MSSPDPFEGLVGNDTMREHLRIALRRPGHAYLLLGRPGYGVGAHARRFAAALAGLPERSLESGHPDLLEVRPRGHADPHRPGARAMARHPAAAVLGRAARVPDLGRRDDARRGAERAAEVSFGAARPRRRDPRLRPAPPAAGHRALALRDRALRAARRRRGRHGARARRPRRSGARARASGGDLERARELLDGGEASDRRERYLGLARSAYADELFDPGAAARAVAEAWTARGAEAREAAEEETSGRVEALGDHPPRAEASRVRREGEALAKRRGRAAEVEEARAAVETLVTWYRDLLAATLGADDALVHSDHREQVAKDAANGREALAARCLEAARDTRRALELTITPTLALEALFHRLRTIARAEQANA